MDSHGTVLESNGFAVIGSGAWIAQASLCQRQYSDFTPLPRASYFIYEAKKLAENEPTVGRTTSMALVHNRFGGGIAFLNGALHTPRPHGKTLGPDVFEKLFKIYGPQKVPQEVEFPELVWPNASSKVLSSEKHEQADIPGAAKSGWSEEAKK